MLLLPRLGFPFLEGHSLGRLLLMRLELGALLPLESAKLTGVGALEIMP